MSPQNRRDFLKSAAASGLAAGFAISGTKASARVLGANDRIRVAVAGINGRGQAHIDSYREMKKDVEIAYLVDPDARLFEPRSKSIEERFGYRPKCVKDIRTILDDKDLDVVNIATPNHWHSLLSIWACQAGKDVYVEKPCSHNVFEGRKLVEAARKYGRIVQHGTQARSSLRIAKTIAAIREGKYGKLLVAYGFASKPRPTIGFKPFEEPPQEFDFDLWLGPAMQQRYHKNIVHYNWHWFWDFGNGEIGNQGVHQMDIARWAMPDDAQPRSIISLGGRLGYIDQGETPNTQLSIIDFGGPKIVFENRGLIKKANKITDEFHTTEGVLKDGMFFRKGRTEGEPIPDLPEKFEFQEDMGGALQFHFDNFIECVRSRNAERLNAEILQGHLSATLCHLANVSYRLGRDVPFSQETKTFGDDRAASDAFESMKDHLAHSDLKLEDTTYRLGPKLDYDAASEKFVGNDEANKLLTWPYRAPFVVPQEV